MSDFVPAADLEQRAAVPRFAGLAALFGAIYFIQGIAEPTEGLIAQPVRSLLKERGRTPGEIAAFMSVMALPWSIKPVFGLIADFLPFGRSPRRNWLVLMTGLTSVGLGYAAFDLPDSEHDGLLLAILLIPTVGVAFTDVVTDALMVERGQPWGMTGRLQSVQWAAMYAATILTGFVGGWLSQHSRQELGFVVCSVSAAASMLLSIAWLRQPQTPRFPGESVVRTAAGSAAIPAPVGRRSLVLVSALFSPRFLAAAGFLFLWNFNPFSSAIQQYYMTSRLGLSEQFYGNTVSVSAAGSVVACIAYGWYCRRLSPSWLIHLSILCGILTTLCYLGLEGRASALVIALLSGAAYMTGTIIQLDLAARVCPPEVSGTLFAGLMALSNLGMTAAMYWGGWLYDDWAVRWGADRAFDMLVWLGAATTAACWVLTPLLLRNPEGNDA